MDAVGYRYSGLRVRLVMAHSTIHRLLGAEKFSDRSRPG
jgi:hypothetical protein